MFYPAESKPLAANGRSPWRQDEVATPGTENISIPESRFPFMKVRSGDIELMGCRFSVLFHGKRKHIGTDILATQNPALLATLAKFNYFHHSVWIENQYSFS